MLKIYNTESRQLENFKPINKNMVTMYSCGMTVNNFPHLGHIRRYLMSDVIYRYLTFLGYKVKHVMNVTDVGHGLHDNEDEEDKMEVKAIAENLTPWDIARKYEGIFFNDLQKINILKPTIIARATEHVDLIVDLVKKLEAKGLLYKSKVGMMYDTSKFKTYPDFAKLVIDNQRAGEGTQQDESRKNLSDFAVWINNKPNHIMKWNSSWGIGYPGWHIECSAMSLHYLGDTVDIHTGGIEHINVHHTNEIAQSEGATGKKFVNYWIHSGHLQVDGEKMSKSLGNVFSLDDLASRGYSPLTYRYMILKGDYKKSFNFTWENIYNSQIEFVKILNSMSSIESAVDGIADKEFIEKFKEAMNNDFNTALAISVLWEVINSKLDNKDKYATIMEFDKVLGLDLSNAKYQLNVLEDMQKIDHLKKQEMVLLLDEREKAKKNKDYAKADVIRKQINDAGYEVLDSKEGSTLQIKSYGKVN